jgi:hypothetical protein
VTLPAAKPSRDPQLGLQGRARIVLASGRRQFVHVWTTPRSPAARLVVVPLMLAALLILAVALLALLAFVAVAFVVAFFALLFGRPLTAMRTRSGSPPRRPQP